MKTILMILMLVPAVANASDCGCVKKKPKPKTCQTKVVTKVVTKTVFVEKEVVVVKRIVKTVRKMNKVGIMGGIGRISVSPIMTATTVGAKQDYGFVGGLSYSRRLGSDSDFLLGVVGVSNKTGMIVLEKEW